MPNEQRPKVQIEFTPEVKRNLRALAKKYRHIVRVQNSDIRKGKRAGYRLIYNLKFPTQIILLTIYSKLEQADISVGKIRRILKEFASLR